MVMDLAFSGAGNSNTLASVDACGQFSVRDRLRADPAAAVFHRTATALHCYTFSRWVADC